MQIWMMRIAALSAAFSDFIGTVFPVMALDKAAVAHLVFIDDLPLVIGVGVLQHRSVCSGVLVGAAVPVHQAHQSSFDLGEISRLLGALGGWLTSSGMLLLKVGV